MRPYPVIEIFVVEVGVITVEVHGELLGKFGHTKHLQVGRRCQTVDRVFGGAL